MGEDRTARAETVFRPNPLEGTTYDAELTEAIQETAFLRDVFESLEGTTLVVDGTAQVVFATPGIESLLGYPPTELLGTSLAELFPGERPALGSTTQGEDTPLLAETALTARHRDGTAKRLSVQSASLQRAETDRWALTLHPVEDPEREATTTQRYETILEAVGDAVYQLDSEGTIVAVNDAALELAGYDREALLGADPSLVLEEADQRASQQAIRELLGEAEGSVRSLEIDLQTKSEETVPCELRLSLLQSEGAFQGSVGIVRNITEEKARRSELLEAKEKYQWLVEAAPDAIFVVDAESDEILEMNAAACELVGRSRDDLRGAHHTELYPAEERERYASIFDEHANTGGIIQMDDQLYVVHDDGHHIPVEISAAVTEPGDQTVVQAMFRDISGQQRRKHQLDAQWDQLEAQRDELARLNQINGVVREINQVLVDADTQTEIEQTVCDCLVEAEPYVAAWIGSIDWGPETVTPRTWAGFDDESMANRTLDIEASDDAVTPTGQAVSSTAVAVAETSDPQRARNADPDWQATAGVPILYRESLYGVLTVGANTTDAFEERERDVLAELGESIGHALAALDRKRALMSESVVELEFRVENLFSGFAEDSRFRSATIEIERTIPAKHGTVLVFLRTALSAPALRELLGVLVESEKLDSGSVQLAPAHQQTGYEEDSSLDQSGDVSRYEVSLEHPSGLDVLTAYGGEFQQARIEHGTYSFTGTFPPGIDVHAVLEAMQATFPELRLTSQRTIPRERPATASKTVGLEELTEKQRNAVELAYTSGYYDQPRETSGDELADSLGITNSTFHQHLRVGVKKLLGGVLGEQSSELE